MDMSGAAHRLVAEAEALPARGGDGGHQWDLDRVLRDLSETPRWLGQATDRGGRTLSVAHHSAWCSRAAWRLLRNEDRRLRAGTALWANGQEWCRETVERVDRAASAAEAHLYVDPSGLPDSNGMLQEPRRPPSGWPELPAQLPTPKRAAAAMCEGFELLAGMLEDGRC